MTQAISISKAKILNYIQCPRRLWLEQYNPELEDPAPAMDAALDRAAAAKRAARASFDQGVGVRIDAKRGLRSALEQTRNALDADAAMLFDAAFEFDAVVMQVDIFRSDADRVSIVNVCGTDPMPPDAIDDCAVQAWTLGNLGRKQITCEVATPRSGVEPSAPFERLFELHDVSEAVAHRVEEIGPIVAAARAVLESLDEPASIAVGPQCQRSYPCPFLAHCARS
jgi:hypothetical protein